RSGLRVAFYASLAVILVAGVALGTALAVERFREQPPILVIDDGTGMGAPTQPGTSDTRGGHWEKLPLAGEGGSISGLRMDPGDPSVLYAITASGLFKTTDGAESWTQVLPLTEGDLNLAIDPASPSTLYVTWIPWDIPAKGLALLRSDDGGSTWTDLSAVDAIAAILRDSPKDGGITVPQVLFDTSASPSTVYIDAESSTLRSTDEGDTWSEVQLAKEERQALYAHDPLAPELMELTGTFIEVGGSSLVRNVGPVVADPDDKSIIYAGTDEGLYKSTDGGKTWTRASTGLTPAGLSQGVSSLVIDPSSPSVLYAIAVDGIYKSIDGGATWAKILAEGMGGSVVDETGERAGSVSGSLAIAPTSPSRLYAWTAAGLFRSDNGGADWESLGGAGLLGVKPSFADWIDDVRLFCAEDPDVVLAATSKGIVRSADGGHTWAKVLDQNGEMRADPNDPSTLYMVTWVDDPAGTGRLSAVLKSVDAGATWTTLMPAQLENLGSLALDAHDPAILYIIQADEPDLGAMSPTSVLRSLDGGVRWERVNFQGIADMMTAQDKITSLLFEPGAPETMYVRTFSLSFFEGGGEIMGLYRSTDGGATWQDIAGELASADGLSIVVGPGGTLYGVTMSGTSKWVPGDE
ncbi:MAG: hypothetical protein ABH877_02840, partial [bacterium]